jgi:hypothetical protein
VCYFVAELPVTSLAAVLLYDDGRHERARVRCLKALLAELGRMRVDQVVLESRGAVRDRRDRGVVTGLDRLPRTPPAARRLHPRPDAPALRRPGVIATVLDTGPIAASLSTRDQRHAECIRFLTTLTGWRLLPSPGPRQDHGLS